MAPRQECLRHATIKPILNELEIAPKAAFIIGRLISDVANRWRFNQNAQDGWNKNYCKENDDCGEIEGVL